MVLGHSDVIGGSTRDVSLTPPWSYSKHWLADVPWRAPAPSQSLLDSLGEKTAFVLLVENRLLQTGPELSDKPGI